MAARLPDAVVGNGCEAAVLLLGIAARLPDAVGNGCKAAVLLLGMTGRLLAVVGNDIQAAGCCWEWLRGCRLLLGF